MIARLILLIFFCFTLLACDHATDETTARNSPAPENATESAAQSRPQWLPDAIVLPADFSQLADRSIGRYTRLLHGVTAADQGALLAEYRDTLVAAGYQVDGRAELVDQGIVRYQGHGLQEASIRFVHAVDRPDGLIQFDARLDNQ